MAKKLYDCVKCSAYCCSYTHIPVNKADVKRLAKFHGISEEKAERKFTKKGDKENPRVIRHTDDEHFVTSCMFLDKDTRNCTIYEGRMKICREFPTQKRCGYYEFLKWEREVQDDPDWIATTDQGVMAEAVDAVVIGAGVIGLAIGRALARAGRDVFILEKNNAFGEETSARNSEVIHAGIQYRPGGVRASLAVKGRDALYAFCAAHNVNHSRCGKLLVATSADDIQKLAALKENAEKNGVDDLTIISAEDAAALEPGLKSYGAILSPSSGIVDSHGLMLALLGEIENHGGALALSSPVVGGRVASDGIELDVGGKDPVTLKAKTVVNCAGLWSDRVARSINGVPDETIPHLKYGKGQYFTYAGKAPFSRLIYPLPAPDSQGVHYTRDLGGQGKLGPDIKYIDTNTDYSVDETRRSAFAQAARKFWPDIDEDKLQPGYAGIRPKLKGAGEEGDFLFSTPALHGVPGYLGLYGIESPGLTTSLAVAERAVSLLQGQSWRRVIERVYRLLCIRHRAMWRRHLRRFPISSRTVCR